MEAAGEVTHISGAEREREIGGIVDIYQRKIGNPLVLFDDIPGYPKGHRILANLLTSIRRINMTMGNPADGTEIELVRHWRKYMKEAKTIPPVRWRAARSWRTSRPATTSTCSRSRCRAGTSTTAAITSAPATW